MGPFKVKREYLLASVCVILRVPSLFIMEMWFRTDPEKTIESHTVDPGPTEFVTTGVYYSILAFALTVLLMPLRKLVSLYMYIVSLLLILMAHHLSQIYVEMEMVETQTNIFTDSSALKRLGLHLTLQCIIAALIAYLIDITTWKRFVLLIYTLPLVARIAGIPFDVFEHLQHFCSLFTLILIMLFLFNNIGFALDIVKENIIRWKALGDAIGWVSLLFTAWHTILLPIQFLVFWIVLFCSQLYVYMMRTPISLSQEGWLLFVLACVGECCATPISLIALCVTIAYASYYILTLTRLYLQGWNAFTADQDVMRGWTEGFTMMLIAVQTGLLDLKPLQRAFLMCVLLFIVASSLIQSMYEMAEPMLLSLSASHNKNIFKHVRAIILFTFLWLFPLYMTYSICQYFDLDFWLLVIMSSCLLTSVQVVGSLVIYTLFMYDGIRRDPWESLDDIVYYTRSFVRILEFVVAVFVVCYGMKESILGEWSWINSSILIIHCYFNVWQRLQSGWKTFLLRREAVKKLESLPTATEEQIQTYNDVCPICYQSLLTAKITPCGHFFHATCLKKWLYVKDTCPMCHKKLHESAEESGNSAEDGPPQNENIPEDNEESFSEAESEVSNQGAEGESSEGNSDA
uniref:RING finger protein 145-like n=1 Tax=Crassostrea virginica TaxID=6565 RepID=A0A8B8F017_CRAVI|nr:RING finger protein 145-like [Crassostrea virginica]XP_022345119.1 RING finger protein 145-like [Crassostrea virginica]XP_022345120.1 RING finger protein 145-like [Crassostrea virginica]XP_022345121.1 RING finger protein 145-like [Crassostrea virginica]